MIQTKAVAFCVFALSTIAGCAPGDEAGAPPSGDTESVVFPSDPPDGPMPEIGPVPEGYTPTAAGSPSTDIWMAALVRDGGTLSVPDLGRGTDRDGYDNQPSFLLDGSAILHTSAVDRTQTEIMRLSAPGESERVTQTSDVSEFSALQIPGQDAFSAIHEIRGKQYLWRYDLSGEPLGPIFATAEPVGYHAWANEHVVAMFILGNPPTLQVGDAITGEIGVVAERPGRSIHRIPGTEEISFVRKVSDEEWWIERFDPADGTAESERIARTLPGREDYAWTPEGEILMGDGSKLYAWSPASEWTEIADFSDLGVAGITRLAVSPDGGRIAIVANRPGG